MQAILVVLSAFFAVVPILAFLWVMWWLDRYDREPAWLFGGAFLWGAIGGVAFALVGTQALMMPIEAIFDAQVAASLGSVLVAPLVEEPTKALILFPIFASRHFDNTTDGFVYGAAAGLGFGMTENFLYFVGVAETGDMAVWGQTVVIRTLYSALMHGCATSVVGAALGFAKFRGCAALAAAVPAGFTLAVAIHALWNGLLTADALAQTGGALTALNLVIFPAEFLLLFAVLQFCLHDERSTIDRQHPHHDHTRRGRDWLPAGVDHHAYVRAATTLAFRKHQARASGDAYYRSAVEAERAVIRRLLAAPG